MVFLVGAPRSGTTWLQSLLGTHPDVVTPQETDLFDRYVAPLDAGWQWQVRGGPEDWASRRFKGLPAVLTRDQFEELLRAFVTAVVDAAAALKPAATILVEKSPAHSLQTGLINRLFPDAQFLHLVRDGRDVAASLLAAGEGWGASWAPRTVRGAAEMWASHVRAAQGAASIGAPYREVRYEDLRVGGAELLNELFAFCGVTVASSECRELVERLSLERMSTGDRESPVLVGGEFATVAQARAEPPGFFGGGRARGWRETWDARERRIFEVASDGLLAELGYTPDDSWIEQGAATAQAVNLLGLGARAASAVLRRASRQVDRWADRLP